MMLMRYKLDGRAQSYTFYHFMSDIVPQFYIYKNNSDI